MTDEIKIKKCHDCGREMDALGLTLAYWYEGDHLYCKSCLETRIMRNGDPYLVERTNMLEMCGTKRAYRWDGYNDFVRRIRAETGDEKIYVGVTVGDLSENDRVCLYRRDGRFGEISEIVQYYNAVNGPTIIAECLNAGCAAIGPDERRRMEAIESARDAMRSVTDPLAKDYLAKMLEDDRKESE